MDSLSTPTQAPAATASLSIGDLAERTGLSPATVRMWEQRHDFPRPRRLDSGHRRYAESDVVAVQQVVRRRDAGVRLDVAIVEALAAAEPRSSSVFADLRRRHPHLAVHQLRKSTLVALSWAIEDEFCAKSAYPHLFGSFQRQRFYVDAQDRWEQLALIARSAFVFADFDDVHPTPSAGRASPVFVSLPPDAPMAREWVIVCDSVELPAALTAWELPGQGDVRDRDRVFEAIWTVEPYAVRDAARVCAKLAREAGCEEAVPVLFDLADDPVPGSTDLGAVTSMFNRVVAYVDRFGS